MKQKEYHGMRHTPLYNIWTLMRQRCNNPSNARYASYGGRGIKVCPQWNESFAQFAADMGAKPEGKSLDRINNDGDYTPENCRWATSDEQRRNMRQTRMVTHAGRTQCLADWARELGVAIETLRGRLALGYTGEALLYAGKYASGFAPRRLITHEGVTHSIPEWCELTGISDTTLRTRLSRGWEVGRALTVPPMQQYNHRTK